ncbi:MAG: ComF family protein [Chlorobi bacterium]|nr:ComF family protein [Chlorobiota bacterium]
MNRFPLWSTTRQILHFVYPPCCLVCRNTRARDRVVCRACAENMEALQWSPEWSRGFLSHHSLEDVLDAVFIAFEYRPGTSVPTLVYDLKYRGLTIVGPWLGRRVGGRLARTSLLEREPVLVPVPLHVRKKRERGYNQSFLICRGMSEVTSLRVDEGLIFRNRYTRSQAAEQLNAAERRRNVKDAFSLHPGASVPPSVALVDDIITTGSTIGECARVLKEAGVKWVGALAVASPLGGDHAGV